MTVFAAIAAAFGIIFARDLLMLWTGNPKFATQWASTLALLATAQCLNGLLYMPGSLQYAFGWTRLALGVQTLCLIVLVPLMLVLTINFGAVGAALALAIVNSLKVLVAIPFMHKRLLQTEMWRWVFCDFTIPAGATFAVVLAVRWLIPTTDNSSRLGPTLPVAVATAAGISIAILTADQMRKSALQILRRVF